MYSWEIKVVELALIFPYDTNPLVALDKNSKEAFIKKLQVCMKNYDYKDETKDVKGKVSILYPTRPEKPSQGVFSAIFNKS